jgi:hypothetical protein
MIKWFYLLFWAVIITTIWSCKKEQFTTNENDSIKLSTDTLWFDTVFTRFNQTSPKSVNKQILVYNPHKKSIRTNIVLAGGQQSFFRLNVDGEPGQVFNDVEILPEDSIFIFVEVHPEQNQNSPEFNPLIIRDSIMFTTNGNTSQVNLIGWGQDAHYILRDSIENDTIWAQQELPVVIYGYCYVKPNVTLTIKEGMKLHFAPGSWLYVEGKLIVEGSAENQVIFQGDRLQPSWSETAGQWGGIWINYPSYDNQISHALIKNGTVGVYSDSIPGKDGELNVKVSATQVRNMTFDGIASRYGNIEVENSVVSHCNRFGFFASFGGDVKLRHNTFYHSLNDKKGAAVGISNIWRDETIPAIIKGTYPMSYYVTNNIIYGRRTDLELFLDVEASKLNAPTTIVYNLIQTEIASLKESVLNNIINQNPQFTQVSEFNFIPKPESPVIGKGVTDAPLIQLDFNNKTRSNPPSIGALEPE